MPLSTLFRLRKPKFGICFDIDGVLARGTEVLDAALKAFQKLVSSDNQIQVPVVFVTNALNRNIDKATQLSNWLGVKVCATFSSIHFGSIQ